jgi:N-acetylglucosaminyl-diphospho-decaprenol L-rhamnosyltransferase
MNGSSIVIVSYNASDMLRESLRGIAAVSVNPETEVIIVDNASTDGSAAMVEREFAGVQLIRNSANVGFARANNQGIRASTGRYVLLLNSDTIVPPGALPALIQFMNDHPGAGACGPRLVRSDGSVQPFAFGGDPTVTYLLARGWNRLLFRRPLHDWGTDAVQAVDWVSGAALLARRAALEQIGGFDEKFFMYFEDNDLCLRLRRAGWKVFYNPTVTITHFGGASLNQSTLRTRWYDASLRYFYSKHYSPFARVALEILLPFYRRIN